MGSVRTVFEALATDIATEVALEQNPDGTGGTTFPVVVLIGDEHLDKLQDMQEGRVCLCLGDDGEIGGPKVMTAKLRTECTWTPVLEAHLWAPAGAVLQRTGLLRLDAFEMLFKCVMRAIYAGNHGANLPNIAPAKSVSIKRETKQLRHGQAAVLLWTVAIPICVGRTLTTMPAGTRLGVTVVPNPNA